VTRAVAQTSPLDPAYNVVGSVISVALGQNHMDQCGGYSREAPRQGLGNYHA